MTVVRRVRCRKCFRLVSLSSEFDECDRCGGRVTARASRLIRIEGRLTYVLAPKHDLSVGWPGGPDYSISGHTVALIAHAVRSGWPLTSPFQQTIFQLLSAGF